MAATALVAPHAPHASPAAFTLGIINESTVVSLLDATHMVDALNIVLPFFIRDWNLPIVQARLLSKHISLTAQACKYCIRIKDYADVDGALGYHDEKGDIPFGLVFAKTVLDNGGAVLWGADATVAQCLAHEAFELLGDVFCNAWWQNPATGEFIAAEVADPVQGGIVPVHLPTGVLVGLSDWVTPAWTDPEATAGPFNHLGNVKAPFEVQAGGYLIVAAGGTVTQRFGEAVPEWVRKAKATTHRHKKRARRTPS